MLGSGIALAVAVLAPPVDRTNHLDRTVGSRKLKELHRQLRRLADQGAVLVTTCNIVGFCALAILEAVGLLPHHALYVRAADDYRDPAYLLGTLTLTAIGGYALLGVTFEPFARLQRGVHQTKAAARHHRMAAEDGEPVDHQHGRAAPASFPRSTQSADSRPDNNQRIRTRRRWSYRNVG